MYVRFPAGRKYPNGYIVPCELIKEVEDSKGNVTGAYVELSNQDDTHKWTQYVPASMLLTDEEVECDG